MLINIPISMDKEEIARRLGLSPDTVGVAGTDFTIIGGIDDTFFTDPDDIDSICETAGLDPDESCTARDIITGTDPATRGTLLQQIVRKANNSTQFHHYMEHLNDIAYGILAKHALSRMNGKHGD